CLPGCTGRCWDCWPARWPSSSSRGGTPRAVSSPSCSASRAPSSVASWARRSAGATSRPVTSTFGRWRSRRPARWWCCCSVGCCAAGSG
ncbi:MAG: hypothetical protein AVDCRST_MAG40-2005, partial [uncultured Gemmatimonadaceae bacterium]